VALLESENRTLADDLHTAADRVRASARVSELNLERLRLSFLREKGQKQALERAIQIISGNLLLVEHRLAGIAKASSARRPAPPRPVRPPALRNPRLPVQKLADDDSDDEFTWRACAAWTPESRGCRSSRSSGDGGPVPGDWGVLPDEDWDDEAEQNAQETATRFVIENQYIVSQPGS
jgi:hypothetical protein